MLFILSDLLPLPENEKNSLASDPFHACFVWLVKSKGVKASVCVCVCVSGTMKNIHSEVQLNLGGTSVIKC